MGSRICVHISRRSRDCTVPSAAPPSTRYLNDKQSKREGERGAAWREEKGGPPCSITVCCYFYYELGNHGRLHSTTDCRIHGTSKGNHAAASSPARFQRGSMCVCGCVDMKTTTATVYGLNAHVQFVCVHCCALPDKNLHRPADLCRQGRFVPACQRQNEVIDGRRRVNGTVLLVAVPTDSSTKYVQLGQGPLVADKDHCYRHNLTCIRDHMHTLFESNLLSFCSHSMSCGLRAARLLR